MNYIISDPAASDSFLPRITEIKGIETAIKSGSPVIISGLRGAGKRHLAESVLNKPALKKNAYCFTVNLYQASSLQEMIISLAKHTLGVVDSNHLKSMREISNYFTQLRPVIEYDAFSGAPIMNFTLDVNYKAAYTLEQLFSYLNRLSMPVYLVMNEFQQILEYRESSVEPLFRELIKSFKNIQVIYTCTPSVKWNALVKANGEGYTQYARIECSPAEHDSWKKFIINRFNHYKRNISDEVADYLLEWCRCHTATVSKVCNRLFASEIRQPDTWQLERILQDLLREHDESLYAYRRLLTINQWLLLKGIAKEKGARQVMGTLFVRRHDLGSASSVQTALLALYEKEMVYESDGSLYLSDVIMSRWMEN